jgi:hypothetical protein
MVRNECKGKYSTIAHTIGQPILAAKVPALTRINRDFVAEAISFETAVI